jgi:hypothetical protein
VRPWRFRINEIGHDRRDASPIVDASFDHLPQRAGLKFIGAWMFISGSKISRAIGWSTDDPRPKAA